MHAQAADAHQRANYAIRHGSADADQLSADAVRMTRASGM